MADYNRCRGPNRFSIYVEAGARAYVALAAEVAYDPAYRPEQVEAAIREALSARAMDAEDEPRDGLFALRERRFGQAVYATQIAGVIQAVEGVNWVRVTGLRALGPPTIQRRWPSRPARSPARPSSRPRNTSSRSSPRTSTSIPSPCRQRRPADHAHPRDQTTDPGDRAAEAECRAGGLVLGEHPSHPRRIRMVVQRACACGGGCPRCPNRNSLLHQQEIPQIVNEVLRSPGQPLDLPTRAMMEDRFAHDFSSIRIYTDPQAAKSAKAVNALAYTVGQRIVFGAGQYAPHSIQGKGLLVHELVHTIQQRSTNPSIHPITEIAPPNDSLENEANKVAKAVIQDASLTQATAHNHKPISYINQPNRLYRQVSSGSSAGPTASHRVVLIDGNVLDQINRGNERVASTLRNLLQSGDEVYISHQAFAEMASEHGAPHHHELRRTPDGQIREPNVPPPRNTRANREMLRELGIRVAPPTGTTTTRGGVLANVETRMSGNISVSDRAHLAEARDLGAEFSIQLAVVARGRGLQLCLSAGQTGLALG